MFDDLPENPTTGAPYYTGHRQYTTNPTDLLAKPNQLFDEAHKILDKYLN